MKSYDPNDKWEVADAKRLKAEPWMLELLALNPEYPYWGLGEDYMGEPKDGGGWSSGIRDSWSNRITPNDLNEIVNFHFAIGREGHNCEKCEGTGQNEATKRIEEDWYDFDGTGRRWCDKLTQDEVDALWEKRRLTHDFKEKPTAAQVNEWSSSRRGIGHDAINRWICVEARATRLGVYGPCEHCDQGTVWDSETAHVDVTAWVLHPRKGASRGAEYRITKADLPEVFAWLREAAQRNADRFAKIPQEQ